MKFNGKTLLILLIIGSLNTVLNAQNEPINQDNNINKVTINEQNINTASSPYRDLTSEEVINTMYPDPLSEGFMGKKDAALDLDRNRSVSDMLSEFESQAKVINDATEVPDDIKDNHTKEERERIEARAEQLLKEKALNESADNKGEKRVKDSTLGEEQNLYSENLASDSSIIASDSLSVESKTDINSATIKDWPSTDEDPEFVGKQESTNSEDDTEIIMVDDGSKPLPDEIPDYSNLSGVITNAPESSEALENSEKTEIKEAKKLSKRDRLRKIMATPLEPVLLTQGKPKSEDDESSKTFSYSGILVPEKQPVSRRKTMIRWTLQLDDGTRIPIKSNLKLMQEVRKEENLEDYVTIKGKMRRSALEDGLRYFIPETITKGKTGVQGEVVDDKKAGSKKEAFTSKDSKNASESASIPLDSASVDDNVATDSSELLATASASTEIIEASATVSVAE